MTEDEPRARSVRPYIFVNGYLEETGPLLKKSEYSLLILSTYASYTVYSPV